MVHFSPLRVRTFAARPRVSGSRGAPVLFFPFVRGLRGIEMRYLRELPHAERLNLLLLSEWALADPAAAHYQADQEQHQKNHEQNPGDLSRGPGHSRKTEHTGDESND